MTRRHPAVARVAQGMLILGVVCGGRLGTVRADDQNFYWKPNTSGNWDVAGNWKEGKVPADNDNAFISQKGVTATLNESARLRKLGLSSPGPATVVDGVDTGANRAKMVVPEGKTLRVVNSAQIDYGWLVLDSGKWQGPLNNSTQGLITFRGTASIDSHSTFAQLGQFRIEGVTNKDARFYHQDSFTNWGTLKLDSPGADAKAEIRLGTVLDGFGGTGYNAFTNAGTFVSDKGGLNNPDGSKRIIAGSVDNKGTMSINTPTRFDAPSPGIMSRGGYFDNTGTVNINGATLTMIGDSFANHRGATKGTVTGKGTVDVKGLKEKKFKNIGGNIEPKQVVGSQLQTEGLVASGLTNVAVLEIIGDYEQVQAAELSIEVDASSAMISHGQLRVTGDSSLGIAGEAFLDADSLVNVSLVNGGEFLAVGQEFPILVADALTGFCPALSASSTYGVVWSVNCDTPNTVMLRVDAVPEPATVALGVMGCVAGLRRRSRRCRG